MPSRGSSVIQLVTFGAGAVTFLAVLAWPGLRQQFEREQLCMLALVVIGIAVNAAICGILSGPHDRYEARVAWLIPFAALTVGFAVMQRYIPGRR